MMNYAVMMGIEAFQGAKQIGDSFKYFKDEPEVDWCDKLHNPDVKQDEEDSWFLLCNNCR